MAVQGSGLGAGPDKGEFVDQTHYDARSGAPKHALKSFDTKWGMKDRTMLSGNTAGLVASDPKTGPDASSPNPLDPEPRVKELKRQPTVLSTSWGTKGAAPDMSPSQTSGKDLHGMPQGTALGSSPTAGKVLGEAVISGATKLPGSVSEKTDSGKAPKAWPASDDN